MRSKSMKHMYLLTVFILLVSHLILIPVYGKVETPQETKEQRDVRMKWWRNARFGMFIHWGLYAIPAGEWKGKPIPDLGEWIMLHAKIPTEEYEPLKDKFNPVEFDADRWVRIAKKTGMKYIVITTKHHDGFCLFDSKYTDYDIMNTPFKRDIMKELSDACRKHGLEIGWYYSLPDWHHPEFPSKHNIQNFHGIPNPDADLEKYLEYLKNQVREILTNYGPISILWFDGGGSFNNMEERAQLVHSHELVDYVRSLQPDIIINDRLGIPADYGTPEQSIPDTGIPGRDWETNMTMNDTWGFKKDDHNWKSSEDLIKQLTDVASKGGNYLLNVGPTALGEIPQSSIERLKTIGKWLKVNGEAIYGTKASPFEAPPWGRYTQKALPGNITRLYLHVFDWPVSGTVVVKGLSNQAKYAYLLADPDRHSLEISQSENELIIKAPERAPDPVNSVIAVDVSTTIPVSETLIENKVSIFDFELKDSTINYYSTNDFPPFYQSLLAHAVETFADDFWRVGPTHMFLFKNENWVDTPYSSLPGFGQYEQLYLNLDSREEVHDYYCENIFMANGSRCPPFSGSGSSGGWWLKDPSHLYITMNLNPGGTDEQGRVVDFSQNVVLGPLHEYVHLINVAYGFDEKAVQSNQQGQSLWMGPAWFVEGMASFVAAYYSYLTPELMDKIAFEMNWSQFSRTMNRYLNYNVNKGVNIRNGVTYNDWQDLESQGGEKLRATIYAGGAVAVVLMMKSSEDLNDLMEIFPLMHQHGFEKAFEMKFKKTLEEFYDEFDSFVANSDISLEAPSDKNSWIGHLIKAED